MLSRLLFIIYNLMVFLSLILNDIPFSLRRLIIIVIALVVVGLSFMGLFFEVKQNPRFNPIKLVSWQSIFFLLFLVPLMRTSLSVNPIEMKIFLFSGITSISVSQYLQKKVSRRFILEGFYKTLWSLWILLVLQGFFGNVNPSELVKTDLGLIDIQLKFAFSGIFSSANHFATLFGFITLLLFYKSKSVNIRVLLLSISLYVFLALDANIALISIIASMLLVRLLYRFRWSFVLVVVFYPILYVLFSAAVFAFFDVQSKVLISMNNRLPMWVGLLAEFQTWSVSHFVLGQGWFSNYRESTIWIYTGIFGQFYSGLKTAHSTSLQLIMDTGVVGFLLYLFFMIKHMCRIKGSIKKYLYYFGPVCFILLNGVSESLFGVYMPTLYMLLLLVILLINTNTLIEHEVQD